VTRRGFTLVELLVTMFVFGVLGTALARLMISNSRFVSQQEAELEARQTARAAMNVMLPELKMVGDGGLRAAARDSIKVRVPYAFGVLCHDEYAILAPADSAVFASAVPGGIAYMTAGGYTFDSTITMAGTTTQTADCDSDSVRAVPGGQRITLTAPIGLSGSIFYLYQTVTYRFANSGDSALAGRRALWRQAQGAAAEELLSPFDTAARFVFLVGSRLTPQLTVPGQLSAVRGLELRLVGASVDAAQGKAEPTRFALHPRLRFGNMLTP
jgi:prepilin-type N-terminal cleavage/methylation domain-containing protein